MSLLDQENTLLVTMREAADEQPDFFVRGLSGKQATRRLTLFPHPSSKILGLRKEQIKYERNSVVELTPTLYLPPGFESIEGPAAFEAEEQPAARVKEVLSDRGAAP